MKTSSMKLGVIGTGNMAGASMGGIIKNQIFRPEEIIGADISPAGRERVKETYGINVTGDNREAAEKSEVLILSVKPQYYADAIAEIKDCISEDQLIITIAPGKTLAWLEEQFGKPVGSDRQEGKVTFADLLGLEGCRAAVREHTEAAKAALAPFAGGDFLTGLAESLSHRSR